MSTPRASTRIVIFVILVVALFLTSYWYGAVLMLLYALLWPGYELLIIAGTIDLMFGHIGPLVIPEYLLTALLLMLISLWLRPILRVYDAPMV